MEKVFVKLLLLDGTKHEIRETMIQKIEEADFASNRSLPPSLLYRIWMLFISTTCKNYMSKYSQASSPQFAKSVINDMSEI